VIYACIHYSNRCLGLRNLIFVRDDYFQSLKQTDHALYLIIYTTDTQLTQIRASCLEAAPRSLPWYLCLCVDGSSSLFLFAGIFLQVCDRRSFALRDIPFLPLPLLSLAFSRSFSNCFNFLFFSLSSSFILNFFSLSAFSSFQPHQLDDQEVSICHLACL